MTIKELKDKIANFDESLEVYISKDEEGNDFRHLYSVQEENVIDSHYGIDVINNEDLYEFEDEDVSKGVVLWP